MGKGRFRLFIEVTKADQSRCSTASIYFENGTTVDIAKIEGGAAYRQAMCIADTSRDDDDDDYPRMVFNWPLKKPSGVAQMLMGIQFLRDYIPSWPGVLDVRTQALSRMIIALKTASASYLEQSFSKVVVVTPFAMPYVLRYHLRSACASVNLELAMTFQLPAGAYVAKAHGFGRMFDEADCYYYSREVILAIDYSRAVVSAVLLDEQCGKYDWQRFLHRTDLGSDGLFGRHETFRSTSGRDDLLLVLNNFTRLSLGKDGPYYDYEEQEGLNDESIRHIRRLVLTGESADNEQLKSVLREVLVRDDHDDGPLMALDDNEDFEARLIASDPLFAASRGAAYHCLSRMQFNEEDGNTWRP